MFINVTKIASLENYSILNILIHIFWFLLIYGFDILDMNSFWSQLTEILRLNEINGIF